MTGPVHRPSDVYFMERLSASAPRPFADAVRAAVTRRGGTMADYVRGALSDQLARDGVPHDRPPTLHRTTYLHRQGGGL